MKRLLISDYKRVFKDKLFLVICIVAVVFAFLTPLLYLVLSAITSGTVAEDMLLQTVNARQQFFAAFAASDNLGLVLPILFSIILYKDISQGTVRNKIISGRSRTSIFLSNFTVCFTVMFTVMLINAFLTLGISLMFFKYGCEFTASELLYFLQSLLIEALVYTFVASLVSWLIVKAKNMGLVIVLYASAVVGLTMVSGFLAIASQVLAADPSLSKVADLLETVQKFNVLSYSVYVGAGTEYALTDMLIFTLTPIVLSALLIVHGIIGFNKKDLK